MTGGQQVMDGACEPVRCCALPGKHPAWHPASLSPAALPLPSPAAAIGGVGWITLPVESKVDGIFPEHLLVTKRWGFGVEKS